MKVVSVEQMRELERRAIEAGVPEDALMEAAGLAVARRIGQMEGGIRGRRIIVFVGPGNNGGDGMVAARYLADWGALVTLYMTSPRRREDKLEECKARRLRIIEAADDQDHWALNSYLPLTDLVVDAVLGIGAELPLAGGIRSALEALLAARSGRPDLQIVAVDAPSGLDADTGELDESTPRADLTLTLGAPKVGLFRFPGASATGTIETLHIGLPQGIDDDMPMTLADVEHVAPLLPSRPLDAHKGTFGTALIVAGSRNYVGASVLASAAAYRAGAGLVTLAAPIGTYNLAAAQMREATYLPLLESSDGTVAAAAAKDVLAGAKRASAAVVGPGLGNSEPVVNFLQSLLLGESSLELPTVIDADALNCLAGLYGWPAHLQAEAVLTPHPGEMSRLMRMSVGEVEENRLRAATDAAREWRQVVVLKGAFTLVAAPDGRSAISPFANPGLATAGSGDVLAGAIGGLMAQGLSPFDAAVVGVHIHAAAGERVRQQLGDSGMMAGDLVPQLPRVTRELRQKSASALPDHRPPIGRAG